MKRIIFILINICLVSFYSVGQKSKVQTAYNYFKDPYNQYDKAKEAIDEAALNEQSSGMAKTWYYRGKIYQILYKNTKYGNLCNNCLITAYESFKKANVLEPKNEWVDEIIQYWMPTIIKQISDSGVAAYNVRDFKSAYIQFETIDKLTPNDTLIVYNCANAADMAGLKTEASKYYSQLIAMKFNDDKIYLNLAKIYREQNDTSKAMQTIHAGRTVYPDSLDLMLAEINILLAAGKTEEVAGVIDAAIKKDPSNASLYLALGSSYDKLANPVDANGKEQPKPKNYNDLMAKSEDAYRKGIAVSPDNVDLNYNLGALIFNSAVELVQKSKDYNTEEYNKAKIKFDQKFKDSAPYFEKALDKNPRKTPDDIATYDATLNSLKQLYVRTGETEKYNKIKALIDQK